MRELFSRFVGPVIDKVLGLRCTSFGYQYGEIAGSLASVYFCGGDCVEDVTSHLMPHLSLHPTLRTCSSDTILRAISELATVIVDVSVAPAVCAVMVSKTTRATNRRRKCVGAGSNLAAARGMVKSLLRFISV